MKITVLVENTSINEELESEHGLSLYIETANHHLLFDAGDSTLFEKNARALGIDLSSVDLFVLSHGHHDHGGGLSRFMEINQRAQIYVHESAFEPHFSKRKNGYQEISVKRPKDDKKRIFYVQDQYAIDQSLIIFSKVSSKHYYPSSNKNLYMDDGQSLKSDDFRHEQNLIIEDHGRLILFAGCAHKGMMNIIDEAVSMMGRPIDYAIGGLHMHSRSTGISESKETILHMGQDFLSYPTKLLTCHCTGESAFNLLKPIMKDKIEYIRTGMVIHL